MKCGHAQPQIKSALKGFGDVSQTRFLAVSVRSGNRQKTHQGPLMPSLPSLLYDNVQALPALNAGIIQAGIVITSPV
jgi:hypothetical protein